MITVDTQIVVYHFLPGENSELTEKLLLLDSDWFTSPLWRYEFRNVLAQYLRRNLVSAENAIRIAESAEAFLKSKEIQIPPTKVVELINKTRCTAYDLEFVAVAEELGTKLVTTDKEILKEFPKVASSIKDYLCGGY